jgi:hypothetical protein
MNWKERHFFSLNLNPSQPMPDDPESTLFNVKNNPAAYPEEPKEELVAEEPFREPEPSPEDEAKRPEGNPS